MIIMKKSTRILLSIIEVIIVIYVISITLLLLCRNKYGYTQFGNKTFISIDSKMKKNLKGVNGGELIVVKSSSKIKKNDLIFYYVIDDDKYILSSGKIKDNKNGIILIGDSVVDKSKIIGKKNITIPVIGKIILFLETKLGFVFCVLLPIVLVFVYELYSFLNSISKNKTNTNSDDMEII